MQTASPTSTLRRLAAAACVVVLGACTSPSEPAAPESEGTSTEVREARTLLGPPMVVLAEATIALGDQLESARYEAARGTAMAAALRHIPDLVDAVLQAAAAAEEAAADAQVEDAAEIVDGAAGVASDAAAAAERELAYLKRLQRIDIALLDVAAEWDRPGSQSEIRERLASSATQAARTRRRIRGIQPQPEACTVMRRNRTTWAATVRARTLELQGRANSAGGREFDELRAAYRRLPLGVEPRTEDQAERACWASESAAAVAAEEVRQAVEALEAALQ